VDAMGHATQIPIIIQHSADCEEEVLSITEAAKLLVFHSMTLEAKG